MLSKKSFWAVFIFSLLLASNLVKANTLLPYVVQADNLVWEDAKHIPHGAKMVVLVGNPNKKQHFVIRIKFPANYALPPHFHPINEYDTVISGKLYLGTEHGKNKEKATFELPAGSFVLIPAKVEHSAWTKEETILQIEGVGPYGITYNP